MVRWMLPRPAFLLPSLLALLVAACASGSESTPIGGASSTSTTSTTGGAGGATTSTTTTSATGGSDAGSVGPVGCVTEVTAGHHVFPCAGSIEYQVEIPAACAAGGCGLVLDMHGYTMNAGQEDAGTNMRALGQANGYIVVQPTASLVTGWVQSVDAPAVFSFVRDLATALLTDPKRAHVMGFSQGGGMAWRMVCDHADFFASAAPISAMPGCAFSTAEAPLREVPILQAHGYYDALLNYYTYAVPERDAALAWWKADAGTVVEGDGGHTATRYLTPLGTPYEFWEHNYLALNPTYSGHCFPGGADVGYSLTQFGCADEGTFVVGELAMQFFVAHPMP
jgi:pimeloyl-ACP methyl ester carboxylesterase